MLLNFQKQFAEPVRLGLKRQTIRSAGARVHVPKVGDVAHCYTGLRTRGTQLLGKWPINRVDVLRMEIRTGDRISDVVLGAQPLRSAELEQLAKADGFTSWDAMRDWFTSNHPPGSFYGWVVGWAWMPADPVEATGCCCAVPNCVRPLASEGIFCAAHWSHVGKQRRGRIFLWRDRIRADVQQSDPSFDAWVMNYESAVESAAGQAAKALP